MRKKTLIGGLVVALAAIYPVASHYHGTKLHEYVDQRVADFNNYLNKDLGIKFSIEAKLEQSGIFESQYVVSVKDDKGGVYPLLKQDIEHGPFPLSNLKKGHFAPTSYTSKMTLIRNEYTEQIFTAVKGEPLVLEYALGYDQKIKGHADFAAFNFKYDDPQNKLSLTADAGTSTMTFNADKALDNVQIDSLSDPITVTVHQQGQPSITGTFGKGKSTFTRKVEGTESTNTSSAQFDGMSMTGDDMPVKFDSIFGQSTIKVNDKTLDFSGTSTYKGFTLNGVNFGQLDDAIHYRRVDLAALKQIGSIASQVFIDALKQHNMTDLAADNAKSQMDKILEPHIFRLTGAAISLFNQSPEVQFGPTSLTNAAGKSEAKIVVGLLFPQLNAGSQEQIILSAISNVDVGVSLNKAWATQFLFDIATLSAKVEKLPLPSETDKTELAAIMDDLAKAATESQLAVAKEGDVQLNVKATPEKGKSIIDTKTISYNGEEFPVFATIAVLGQRAEEAERLLKAADTDNRLKAFMARFGVK